MFSNRTGRYLKYAFGEIILIILGIFLALQLQNWNEKRKQQKYYRNGMEKIYNGLSIDIANIERIRGFFNNNIITLDFFLNNPDTIPDQVKPRLLSYIATTDFSPFKSETSFYLDKLVAEENNVDQMELLRQVVRFNKDLDIRGSYAANIKNSYLSDVLIDMGIQYPKTNIEDLGGGYAYDSLWYTKEKLDKISSLIKQEPLRDALKTFRIKLSSEYILYYNHLLDAQSILNSIKKEYPDVKIIYRNVGIIGTSIDGFDDVGGRSTPMTNTDEDNSIWEIKLYLKEGRVKFRCHDSWAQNWGAQFNSRNELVGKALFDGADIEIEQEGNYHIILNLKENTYSFDKIED